MGGYLPAVIVAGAGLVVLVVLVLAVLGPVRRLSAARGTLRAGLQSGTAPLSVELDAVRARRAEPAS